MNELIQTEESLATEADIVKTVQTWEAEGRKQWAPTFKDMIDDDKIYRNEMNYTKTKKKWQSKIAFPQAFRTVQTLLSIIKDYLPGTDIIPREENDVEFAQLAQMRFDHEADKAKLNRFYLDCSEDMLRMKNGIGKVTWEEEDGKTGLVAEVLNPAGGVIFSREATSVETAAYIIIIYPMTLTDIKREKDFDAKPDTKLNEVGMFEPFDNQNEGESDRSSTVTDLDGEGETYATAGADVVEGKYAFVREVWYTDPEDGKEMMVEVINSSVTSKHPETGERMALENTAESDIGYGRKPIFLMKNNGSKHALYGRSEMQITESIDVAYNETSNSILDWIRLAANPPKYKLMSFLMGKTGGKFFGKHNEDVLMNRPDEAGYMKIPGQPNMAQAFGQQLKEEHADASGIYNETVGKASTGVTSGVAIAELKEAGSTVGRFKVENEITDFIEDVSKFAMFLIMKFDKQTLTLTKEDNNEFEFIQWDSDVFRSKIGFELEKVTSWEDTPFNIKVKAGQQQPKTRAELIDRATKLYDMQVYGVEQVVRDLGLPDGKKTIQMYYERQGWSPEAVEERATGLIEQMQADPENKDIQARLDELMQVFPSIIEPLLKKVKKEGN